MNHIGTLAEKSLHAALKEFCGRPGDSFETEVDGFIIDLVRGDVLIEIQTRHLYRMKRKLKQLLPQHPIHLVHPIPSEKWIVRQTETGEHLGRRKSPKRGQAVDLFHELVRMTDLLSHPHLTIELLLTQQDEIWRDDGQGSWRRRRWSIYDRRLLGVGDSRSFHGLADYCALLPADLPHPFSSQDLADALGCRPGLARKMSYTLRQIGGLLVVGKKGNALLYEQVGE
jgi:hypothetical protein